MALSKAKAWPVLVLLTTGVSLALYLAGSGAEEPLPQTRPKAQAVETMGVKRTGYRIQVPAWGIIEPCETIDIRTEISGKVNQVSSRVYAGARVKQGVHLFSIDERDYLNTLKQEAAAHEKARQALAMEKGRQTIARTEWELLQKSGWRGERNQALALRQPQLKECRAAVEIAAAKQAQAALDVERARISAPCNGVIIEENLAEGQVLDTGHVAMQLACTDRHYIRASYSPTYSLDPDSKTARVALGSKRYVGVIKSLPPRVDPQTRQKQALVELEGECVLIGAYARLILPGRFYKDVVVLPKEAIHPGNTVWLFGDDHTLEIRRVEVLAQDGQNVVIGKGLGPDDRIVLSHISSPLKGMPLNMMRPVAKSPDKTVKSPRPIPRMRNGSHG